MKESASAGLGDIDLTRVRASLKVRSFQERRWFAMTADLMVASVRIGLPFFAGRETRGRAWGYLSVFFVVTFFSAYMLTELTRMDKERTDALNLSKPELFWPIVRQSAGMMFLSHMSGLVLQITKFKLMQAWRTHMTDSVLASYLGASHTAYRLKTEEPQVDNPDQRIVADVEGVSRQVLSLVLDIWTALIQMAPLTVILWRISRGLFCVLFSGSVLVTLAIARFLGSPMMRLTNLQLSQEASLRFDLVRLREHAEEVAFFKGQDFERARCQRSMGDIVRTSYAILRLDMWLRMANSVMGLYTVVIPKVFIGVPYFKGERTLGDLQQVIGLWHGLWAGFNMMNSRMRELSSTGATLSRVKELQGTLSYLDATDPSIRTGADLEAGIELEEVSGGSLCLEVIGLQLRPPRSSIPLIADLTLSLTDGERLLVTGPSGAGKSSLLRAIAGLWGSGAGRIRRRPALECFFLPQSPYLCTGTLRENACYPKSASLPDAQIKQALAAANCAHLERRFGLDSDVPWDDVLSGGERQRLGFVRLQLYSGLRFAILDEATAAMDAANEDRAYALLARFADCFVSVGHRPSLLAHHTRKLTLSPQEGGSSGELVELPLASPS